MSSVHHAKAIGALNQLQRAESRRRAETSERRLHIATLLFGAIGVIGIGVGMMARAVDNGRSAKRKFGCRLAAIRKSGRGGPRRTGSPLVFRSVFECVFDFDGANHACAHRREHHAPLETLLRTCTCPPKD
jgi:hypothetical protein